MSFSPTRHRFLQRAVTAAYAASAVTLWPERGEADALSVTRRDLALPGWPEHAAGLKIGPQIHLFCPPEVVVLRLFPAA